MLISLSRKKEKGSPHAKAQRAQRKDNRTQIYTDVKDKEKLMSKPNINPLTTITLVTLNFLPDVLFGG